MLSQKYIYISIIAILAGILVSLFVVIRRGMTQKESAYSVKQNLQVSLHQHAIISPNYLNELLSSAGYSTEHLSSCTYLMIIPPSPCEGCVITQQQIFAEQMSEKKECSFCILAPSKHAKDTRIYFSSFGNVSVYEYPEDLFQSSYIAGVQGVVLCFIRNGSIEHVYISNAFFPHISNEFFEY